MKAKTLCGEPKPPVPTTANDPCVRELGHEGMHCCRHGEWWGGQPEG